MPFTAGTRGVPEPSGSIRQKIKEMGMTAMRVHVREYSRIRFGRRERVRKHTRRWPRQYRFDF